MNTHVWLSKLVMALVSLLQATSLRERYYTLEQRVTILETAIDDIARINSNRSRDPLITGITDRIRNNE